MYDCNWVRCFYKTVWGAVFANFVCEIYKNCVCFFLFMFVCCQDCLLYFCLESFTHHFFIFTWSELVSWPCVLNSAMRKCKKELSPCHFYDIPPYQYVLKTIAWLRNDPLVIFKRFLKMYIFHYQILLGGKPSEPQWSQTVIYYCVTGQPGRPGRAFDGQPGQPGERGHTGRPGRRGHAGLRGPPGVCLTSGCAQDSGTSGSPQPAQRRQRSRP